MCATIRSRKARTEDDDKASNPLANGNSIQPHTHTHTHTHIHTYTHTYNYHPAAFLRLSACLRVSVCLLSNSEKKTNTRTRTHTHSNRDTDEDGLRSFEEEITLQALLIRVIYEASLHSNHQTTDAEHSNHLSTARHVGFNKTNLQ